ncbi:coat protein [ssRNA phage SRR7976357_10]|uniref:Coat protein n=1 Tax=ssRNA phage SRR7976357_10 TaxID=2786739 RepID=A0A8S5KZV3_9VIRU|nr:coat protein [ssRNA phage SRR7976357_10]DAD51238.1 TPA_asm: coat protein [ssRNA phage SRR7976357_10]
MFSDPQSITYATVSKSLPAISRGENSSVYRLDASGVKYELTLSHQFAKRNRAVARLTRVSAVTDPLVPANYQVASMAATFTVDFPVTGLTASDAQNLGDALVGFLTSANILKLVGGET